MARFPPMDEAPRYFTVEEANELVADLEIEFGRVARVRSELAPLVEALGEATVEAILQDGAQAPPGKEREARRLVELASEIALAVERVNAHGVLVKDIDLGLVDFYAMQDDEPVFLCWQYGEPAVTHWHGLEEGFAGRRPIEGIEVVPPSMPN